MSRYILQIETGVHPAVVPLMEELAEFAAPPADAATEMPASDLIDLIVQGIQSKSTVKVYRA